MSTVVLPDKVRQTEEKPYRPSDAALILKEKRIDSLDIIRGTVMALMAIDHVRVYSGLPAGGPTPGIFFTRWVTHFCAPIFVFLAGTGAYLYGQKQGNIRAVAQYLAARGTVLVFLELTLLRLAWTFNFDYRHYLLAGVIWVIGWCMILMALLVRLPAVLIGALGVAVIAGHNLIDPFLPRLLPYLRLNSVAWIWQILYFGGPVELEVGGPTLAVLYSIIPWIGVMGAGYAFGVVMRLQAKKRDRTCFQLGAASILLFLLLRAFNFYGDPRPWRASSRQITGSISQTRGNSAHSPVQGSTPPTSSAHSGQAPQSSSSMGSTPSTSGGASPAPQSGAGSKPNPPQMPPLLAFLNTNKYPASLLFLFMTLGPMFIAIPLVDQARGPIAEVLKTFGRVPFFYYLLHIPVVHAVALLVSMLRLGSISPWLFANHPMGNPPPPNGYSWSLGVLYVVWAGVLVLLYVPCRWFAQLKSQRRDTWLSFL